LKGPRGKVILLGGGIASMCWNGVNLAFTCLDLVKLRWDGYLEEETNRQVLPLETHEQCCKTSERIGNIHLLISASSPLSLTK